MKHHLFSLHTLAGITVLVLIGMILSPPVVFGNGPTWPDQALMQQTPPTTSEGVIAFVLENDDGSPIGGKADIYVVNADGSNLHTLTHHSAVYSSLAWSSDGRQLAFVHDSDGIHIMNAEGTQTRYLTEGTSPVWSPDGSRIAYVSEIKGNREISIVSPYGFGSQHRHLTENSADESQLQWSPNGSQIAFVSSGSDGQNICVVDSIYDYHLQCLTNAYAGATQPRWSPDGTQIAFVSHRTGNQEIYVIHADGSNLRQLTDNRVEDRFPAWSPDGSQIAFESKQGETFEIYVIDADGSNLRRLTDNDTNDNSPQWSPDGSQIAFEATRDHIRGIYVMDVDGSNTIHLASADLVSEPVWQPVPSAAAETAVQTIPSDVPKPEMVLVPAGCFMMGSDSDESSRISPAREVCLETFWIDRYEVTNAQFAAFGGQAMEPSGWTDDNRPRENITWAEAQAFCERRGARLPTEAEWEYAARGPENLEYPWGNEWDPDKVVWGQASNHESADVGSKPEGASWVGAMDMSGNVSEWVADWLVFDAEDFAWEENSTEPVEMADGIMRGGHFINHIDFLRAWEWSPVDLHSRDAFLGFRCARSASPDEAF